VAYGASVTLPRWQQELVENAELYRVGGSVRDRVLGCTDVVDTDYLVRGIEPAVLESILARHGRVALVGKVFGVYHFTPAGESPCDIAFPRTERSTGTGHRDFEIQTDWRLPVEADLRRRDFTINAMAERVPAGNRIDPFGGAQDLEAKRLRMIFPEAFTEDPLRILRGARFVARFGLSPEPATEAAMRDAGPLLATVSAERVQDEISKMLTQSEAPGVGFDLLQRCHALRAVLPELDRAVGVTQNEYHPDDVYRHTLKVCDAAPRSSLLVRWAALLHDLGKVDTRQMIREGDTSRVVFYGHEVVGADMALRILERLRYPRAFVQRSARLVREHMFRYERTWKPATVRRLMARVGVDLLEDLFALREADCRSRDLSGELDALNDLRERVATELRERSGVHITDLEVDGGDIMRTLAIGAGPDVGRILQSLLERVIEKPELNRRETLIRIVQEEFGGAEESRGR
jgi:poly(A) polymerase/tRNA nucleotidyltransferase (CCA-adding enzyme)